MNKALPAVLTIILALIIALPCSAYGATLYVGPAEAYTEIQPAISATVNGDTIIVRDGTYTGANNKNLDFGGKVITLQSENGAATCIIDCQNNGRGFYFHSGETSTSILHGFTVTNGNASGGGGILCESSSSPMISNCIISNSAAGTMGGGGMQCFYSSPTIDNCIFTNNHSQFDTGGIHCYSSSPIIRNCIISNNSAGNNAGGIYCVDGSFAIISNCIISGNSASVYGGGINSSGQNSSPTITNCTIVGNSASYGGAIFCSGWIGSTATATLENCILWGNSAAHGPQIALRYAEYPSSITLNYSDVEGGQEAAFVDAGCTLTWGPSNIDADPAFIASGDYHLTSGSPCVDAGTDAGVYTDIDGDARPQGSGFDMGADEAVALVDEDGDGYTTADGDCNDNDSSVYPGAPELCDGKDNDCDTVVPADEVDGDGDGFMICAGDCDDTIAAINPDAYELPGNAVDENCDGSLGACDPGAEWKNHGQFVRCVAHETDALIEASILTQDEGDALISSAAQSDVGKK